MNEATSRRHWRIDDPRSAHGYFLLRAGAYRWIGHVAPTTRDEPRHACNVIRPHHLLGSDGVLYEHADAIEVSATHRRRQEAKAFMALVRRDPLAVIHFPIAPMRTWGHEFVCPPAFWARMAERAEDLAAGERHMRALCAATLRTELPDGALVRDPACSTGDFVVAMAHACPRLHFEGSDRAADMIRTARTRHPDGPVTFSLADAALVPPASCDALVLRFLNAEVVTRAQADALFDRLVPSVRRGGLVVLFGHTPVLVDVHQGAARHGLRIQRSVAPTGTDGIVPYYVLRA
ncbi:class I SAM-dependent methyltransferase [Luteibacter sp. ME-Dv--P-043b]|uniref:class I SAM-dependent methyltransferase n=1 Tax=Luteibacter sp. ME-Dv--P-043b TaxID=3040291 RepID=UPI002555C914|nr:class I SAM-dependent methyltransferase [Luteibacter sp. ME-Dv--P-043b]